MTFTASPRPRRGLMRLGAVLTMTKVSSFLAPIQPDLTASRSSLPPQSLWSSPFAVQCTARRKGVLYSLIINPKRQGITQVGIEEIKTKKAALQAPPDLKGQIFVTGTVDEQVYSLLNEQRVWSRITCFAPDPLQARKRLTSRSTRYSGLLDLLNIQQGDPLDLNHLEAYLKDKEYNAWLDVSVDADPERLLSKAKLVASSGIKFFVTALRLTEEALTQQQLDLQPVVQALQEANVRFRILVTGPVIEAPATGYVRLNTTNELLPNSTITRGDLSRVATEFFLITEMPEAPAIYVTQGDENVVDYLRFCREQGMNYKQEINDMLQGGLYTYREKKAEILRAEQEKASGMLRRGNKTDSQVYADYRMNITSAAIATAFDKKRRTLVGMVKKIVNDILEEEYDDMYYSMRTRDDLVLYKKANWSRAVQLVLQLLTGEAHHRKETQRLTGFQDPYLGPQWHIIKANAAVMIKIKELHGEIGDRLSKEDWEKYDMLEGDFMGDEEAVLSFKIEERTRRNKNYLRDTLSAPSRRKANLVVEEGDLDDYRQHAVPDPSQPQPDPARALPNKPPVEVDVEVDADTLAPEKQKVREPVNS